jgi:hypothetical protein
LPSPVNALTDPDTGLRHYYWNGQELISATSIRRVVGMPFSLANWMVKQVVDAAVANPGLGAADLRKQATLQRDEAAKLGTAVHEAAESHQPAVSLPDTDERKPFLVQFERWKEAMKPRILVNEAQVFNLKEGYAGSLDMIADVKGHRVLIDLKTGKGIYTDHALQLALYYCAEFVGGYDPILDKDVVYEEATKYLNECDSTAILHLRPDSWEWVPIEMTDEVIAAAADMVRFSRFLTNHPTIDTLKGVTK